ncbi:MAG: glycerol-3-phosphate 1-O-acyltransferase PlsY [Candidatus Rokubacteria bacterium]|nr:glycerol-3-phosphate 1-O-acyltransferase PlsY [Candidatus Rokubacteria bacterium]
MSPVLGAAVAYVIGAVPIGFLIARAFGVGDIRRHGSGNIGMTNVLRTAGKLPAILTLLGDVVKGALAVIAGGAVADAGVTGYAVSAVAAVAGNCWSVFLRFRGGKGVATGLGALLVLVKLALVPAALVFLVVTLTTRYVSLGSLLASIGVPVVAWALGYPGPAVIASAVVAGIIVLRHHANITRLLDGTESRMGERAKIA